MTYEEKRVELLGLRNSALRWAAEHEARSLAAPHGSYTRKHHQEWARAARVELDRLTTEIEDLDYAQAERLASLKNTTEVE